MRNKLIKRNDGFTIIEVMIVLAIAGLIMLIVFLAVPALQRNSRNTQRNNDASKIVAAVNECVSNNNGKVDSCDTNAEIAGTYITLADNAQLIDNMNNGPITTASLATGTNAPSTSRAIIQKNVKCTSDGTDVTNTGATARTYVVVYMVETNNGSGQVRCLGS